MSELEKKKKEKKVQLILECNMTQPKEILISEIAALKYRLPAINSYVVEIYEKDLPKLKNIEGVKAVYENARITAQMNNARKVLKSEYANNKGYTGKGITIAFLDTGIAPLDDFVYPSNRIIAFKDFISNKTEPYDDNGHGTHVTGICAGNGIMSDGKYKGIAPNANIISLKTLNSKGSGNSSDVLAGIQWVIDNAERYNIKIVNLSMGTEPQSADDPLVKAVEFAWDSGIIVTTAAGNNGPKSGTITSPGISKKVITVGTSNDNNFVNISGTSVINFSGRGPTRECVIKPDVIAPGTDIISCMTPTPYSDGKEKIYRVGENYMKLSGTSMSTPMITGAIALLLEKYPSMMPDDVKYALKCCAVDLNYPHNRQGWGIIDIEKLIEKEEFHVRH